MAIIKCKMCGGDFSMEAFKKRFNADLANDLGNLLSRTLNMAAKNLGSIPEHCAAGGGLLDRCAAADGEYDAHMENLEFDKALDAAWLIIGSMNKYIDETKPWSLAKTEPEKTKAILLELVLALRYVCKWITPFMPETSKEMARRLKSGPIEKYPPLFPRIEA